MTSAELLFSEGALCPRCLLAGVSWLRQLMLAWCAEKGRVGCALLSKKVFKLTPLMIHETHTPLPPTHGAVSPKRPSRPQDVQHEGQVPKKENRK